MSVWPRKQRIVARVQLAVVDRRQVEHEGSRGLLGRWTLACELGPRTVEESGLESLKVQRLAGLQHLCILDFRRPQAIGMVWLALELFGLLADEVDGLLVALLCLGVVAVQLRRRFVGEVWLDQQPVELLQDLTMGVFWLTPNWMMRSWVVLGGSYSQAQVREDSPEVLLRRQEVAEGPLRAVGPVELTLEAVKAVETDQETVLVAMEVGSPVGKAVETAPAWMVAIELALKEAMVEQLEPVGVPETNNQNVVGLYP